MMVVVVVCKRLSQGEKPRRITSTWLCEGNPYGENGRLKGLWRFWLDWAGQ